MLRWWWWWRRTEQGSGRLLLLLLELYKVSYAWYGLIGITSCLLIAVTVSLITGGSKRGQCIVDKPTSCLRQLSTRHCSNLLLRRWCCSWAPPVQQSIDICCPPGAQQQTRSSGVTKTFVTGEHLAKSQARAWLCHAVCAPGHRTANSRKSARDNHVLACNFAKY